MSPSSPCFPFSVRSTAITPILLALFAIPALNAQIVQSKIEPASPPPSIIHLASTPRPQGQLLARNPHDATFEHLPTGYHVFAAATVGEDSGVENLRLSFEASTRLTSIQSKNKDFVVESGGTCHVGNTYKQGDSCSLSVRFNPQGPGHRSGSINIAHSAEASPMFVGLTGNGYAPVISFTPSQISTVAGTVAASVGTIKSSTNLAIDGGDILYVPDIGNINVKEIDSSGAIKTLSFFLNTPASIAADSAGSLYFANTPANFYYFGFLTPWGSETAYGTTYAPATCTPSAPCSLGSVGLSRPANLSMDPSDNLFFEEGTRGAAEMPVANLAGGNGGLSLWYLYNQFTYASGSPAPFAVDPNDNLYNFYTFSTTCILQTESAYSATYAPVAKRVAGGVNCGFSGDGGQARGAEISRTVGQIAFDSAGNLYFADAGNQRIRRIDASTGIINTIAGNGTAGYSGDGGSATTATIASPTGLAVDSQGQVYILSNAPTVGPTQVLRKVGTLGYWSYNPQLKGTTSATKVFTVSNTGNSDLTLAANTAFTGANPSDFSIDSTATNCVLTLGATLPAGHSCFIGIKFTPSAGGSRSAFLNLLDNTVTGSNRISVTGTGTLAAPIIKVTSPTLGATATAGSTVTFAVTVTSTSSPIPTGTVTFKVNGAAIGSPVALSVSGVASTTFTQSTAATYSLSAVYSGDANFAPVTVTQSLVITAKKVAAAVSLSRGPVTTSCSSTAFLVHVAAPGAVPTGTIQLKSGTALVASTTLTKGFATLSINKLQSGVHTFTARYSGDTTHLPAASTPLNVTIPVSGTTCGTGRVTLSAAQLDLRP